MERFIDLRTFCLLKNPYDREHPRDALANKPTPWWVPNRGWSPGRCLVSRYDVAKDSWERFGDAGPPAGTEVYTVHHVGLAVVKGVVDGNLVVHHPAKAPAWDHRPYETVHPLSQWWLHVVPTDHMVNDGAAVIERWDTVTE